MSTEKIWLNLSRNNTKRFPKVCYSQYKVNTKDQLWKEMIQLLKVLPSYGTHKIN